MINHVQSIFETADAGFSEMLDAIRSGEIPMKINSRRRDFDINGHKFGISPVDGPCTVLIDPAPLQYPWRYIINVGPTFLEATVVSSGDQTHARIKNIDTETAMIHAMKNAVLVTCFFDLLEATIKCMTPIADDLDDEL